jgi:hypothetical protein
LVDSLLGSAMPGSLFEADATFLPIRKAVRKEPA